MKETKLEQFDQALSAYLDQCAALKQRKLVTDYFKNKSVLRHIEKKLRSFRKRMIG